MKLAFEIIIGAIAVFALMVGAGRFLKRAGDCYPIAEEAPDGK